MELDVTTLTKLTGSTVKDAWRFLTPLKIAMNRFEINTPLRVSAFLATVSVESARLTKTEEDLYYKRADRLLAIYPRAFKTLAEAEPYVRNSLKLSQKLYGKYHGRGLIQLTWERNYERYGRLLGYDYLREPDLVAHPDHAALTAGCYWHDNGCNEAADADDMELVTEKVNGKRKMHLEERVALYTSNVALLGVA